MKDKIKSFTVIILLAFTVSSMIYNFQNLRLKDIDALYMVSPQKEQVGLDIDEHIQETDTNVLNHYKKLIEHAKSNSEKYKSHLGESDLEKNRLNIDSILKKYELVEKVKENSENTSSSQLETLVLLNRTNDELNSLRSHIESERQKEIQKNKIATTTFWIKVVFSLIFCASALFVILTQKYDDQTKKWAIGVLTLIGGVWIGSVTS